MSRIWLYKTAVFIIFLSNCTNTSVSDKVTITFSSPDELYGQLFYDVQSNEHIFNDSKTFVDCVPLYNVTTILDHYSKIPDKTTATMLEFISNNFRIPQIKLNYITDSSSVNDHITKLWKVLERPPDERLAGSLIPLPFPYIVPGGRFREVYYWDSYFTILGLQADHQTKAIQNMIDNFSWLIDTFGFIPNGNRTYYLSRSQPPFYALMVSALAELNGDSVLIKHLTQMEKEYTFWMNGSESLTPSQNAFKRVVMLPDGEILNRYWDDKNTPRPESYREDMHTAKEAKIKLPDCIEEEVFRNIRAAAESGWDFSSRWLSVDADNILRLYTIHTTDIIPVDLNSLLYNLEYTLAKTYRLIGDQKNLDAYKEKYELRKKALMKYCWNNEKGFFMDYDFKHHSQTKIYSLAGVFPLFFNMTTKDQAMQIAKVVQQFFLKPGGVVTTLNKTNQQWDSPNGWAPLQWITIQGLRNYGYDVLANNIKDSWLDLNKQVYNNTFKMLEKYNVEEVHLKGGGGEYPTQDGFGWTNGVYQKLSLPENKHKHK